MNEQKPAGPALIAVGFVMALLFPLIGLVIALFVMTRPGGTVIGLWIFVLAVAVMVLSYAFLFS